MNLLFFFLFSLFLFPLLTDYSFWLSRRTRLLLVKGALCSRFWFPTARQARLLARQAPRSRKHKKQPEVSLLCFFSFFSLGIPTNAQSHLLFLSFSAVKILLSEEPLPGSTERSMTLSGTNQGIHEATLIILRQLASVRRPPDRLLSMFSHFFLRHADPGKGSACPIPPLWPSSPWLLRLSGIIPAGSFLRAAV